MSPCSGCRAALCCASDFPLFEGEAERIRPHVPTRALARIRRDRTLLEPRTTGHRCPMLDDDNSCAIYEHRPDLWAETDPGELELLRQVGGRPEELRPTPIYIASPIKLTRAQFARYQIGGRREDRIAPKPPSPGALRRWLRETRDYSNAKIRRIPLGVQRRMYLASVAGLDREGREMEDIFEAKLREVRAALDAYTDKLFAAALSPSSP